MRAPIALFTILVLGSIPAARADVIHVPADYPTIQQGIDAAGAGDIVMVAAGEYFEEINLKAGVIVQGAGKGVSIINGGGDSGDVVRAIGNDITSDTKFTGFTVTGAISGGSMPGGGGIFCNSGASPEICNNRCEGNDSGIVTWNNSGASIHNNVVVHNNHTGIALSSASDVMNNTIGHNNNGLYDNGGWRPTVMNNIIFSNANIGLGCVSASHPVVNTYNDVWDNATDYHNCSPGTGDISQDPLFVDDPGGDWRLDTGSPCIDAGNPLPEYNDPDGTRNDMGAFGGPGAPITTPGVSMTVPAANALPVALDADVSAVFTIEMDPSTLTTDTALLHGDLTGLVTASLAYDAVAKMVTLDPVVDFRTGERIRAYLTHDITSVGGDSLEGYAWQFTGGVADGSGSFGASTSFGTTEPPAGMVAGDLDLDGALDLVLTTEFDQVAVLMGVGDGSFGPPTTIAAGLGPIGLCTGELNGDGMVDLVVASNASGEIPVFLGNGDGTFTPHVTMMAGLLPFGVCLADFSYDGHLDMAVTNQGSDDISVWLGSGDGSFGTQTRIPVGSGPTCLTSGDIDMDGILDLVVVNGFAGTITVLFGAGDGSFGNATSHDAGSMPRGLDLGDLDGDGDLDVVLADMGGSSAVILLGDGDGGFSGPAYRAVGADPQRIRLGDLNADGVLDLMTTNAGDNALAILLGSGDGTFGSLATYTCGLEPEGIAQGDWDGDGDLDLAAACHGASAVSILLNQNTPGIAALSPDAYENGVASDADIAATFDLRMEGATLEETTYLVRGRQSGGHGGEIFYDPETRTVVFEPNDEALVGEVVSATLTSQIMGENGVPFPGFGWSFTVGPRFTSDGVFDAPTSYPTASDPRGLFAADYDGDGDVDLAVASSDYPNPGRVAIHMNNGDGTFAAAVSYALGAPDPIGIFGADFDGDGDIDLATSHNEPGSSHLTTLRNRGDGTFTQSGLYAPAILGQRIGGGDLDADGDVDLVMTDGWGSSNNVHVLTNTGAGLFGPTHTYSAGTYARDVKVEDVDGDGDWDLAVASAGDDNLSLLFNDGEGDFSTLANVPVGDNPTAVWGSDLNGDGDVDFAVGGYDNISIILSQGGGSFSAPVLHSVAGSAGSVVAADVDGDGDMDLAAAVAGSQSVWVAPNDGTGVFGPATEYTAGDFPYAIDAGDFDLDGDIDLASTIYNRQQIVVLNNAGSAGVGESGGLLIARDIAAAPNPFRGSITLSLRLPVGDEHRTLGIFDLTGRKVRQLAIQKTGTAHWDGTDDQGRRVGQGTYYCRYANGDRTLSHRVVYIR